MKLPLTHCPRCNSLQKFFPHKKGEQTVMLCRMCHTETVIDNGRPTRRLRRATPLPKLG